MHVRPKYGWGWVGGERRHVDYEPIDRAGPFEVRIDRLFTWKGELRGLVGGVVSPSHLFSGLHVVAAEMLLGANDLTDSLCGRWDLQLGTAPPNDEEWPVIAPPALRFEGYAYVGASGAHVDAFLDELFKAAERR